MTYRCSIGHFHRSEATRLACDSNAADRRIKRIVKRRQSRTARARRTGLLSSWKFSTTNHPGRPAA